jgi:hypothetical protein
MLECDIQLPTYGVVYGILLLALQIKKNFIFIIVTVDLECQYPSSFWDSCFPASMNSWFPSLGMVNVCGVPVPAVRDIHIYKQVGNCASV